MSDVTNTAKNHGFTLIEVLVAMAISAVGLLGFLSLHTHMVAADTEISRQAKAAALVQYMSAQVQAYPTLGEGCASTIVVNEDSLDCDSTDMLMTWQTLINHSINQSALPDALGCISYVTGADDLKTYTVSIDWRGSLSSLPASPLTCNSSESGNRTLTYTVVVNEAL